MPGEGFEPSRAGAHECLRLARLPDFAIPARSKSRRLTLRADEGIERANVRPPGDRDLVRFGIRGTNADREACLPDNPTDVLRSVREEIPRVGVSPVPNSVDDAAPVRMDQPTRKAPWLLGNDRRLPGGQLRPRTVLGEHARPVLPIGVHLDTPDMVHGSNTIDAPPRDRRPADSCSPRDLGVVHAIRRERESSADLVS